MRTIYYLLLLSNFVILCKFPDVMYNACIWFPKTPEERSTKKLCGQKINQFTAKLKDFRDLMQRLSGITCIKYYEFKKIYSNQLLLLNLFTSKIKSYLE